VSNPLPKTDVVVIGLGAAGGIASYVLTEAGLNVVGIEAGPRLTLDEIIGDYDEITSALNRNKYGAPKYNKEVPTWRPNADTEVGPPPSAPGLMANAVGGTTIHYGAQSWRYREDDFLIRSRTVDRYGEESLPEGNSIADWPVTYQDLEPYYDKVEYLIGVSGVGGANPFESTRSRDYPLPPLQETGYMKLAKEAMGRLGYHPFQQPAAIISQPYGDNRPACTYCGFCQWFGCWNHSKSSTFASAIPAAEKTGKLEVRANSRVTKILSNDKGEVTGVEYIDENGQLQTQPAGVVILSSFVFENTRLLLLSPGAAYPDGLSNNHGQVGKHYIAHGLVSSLGLFPGQLLNLDSGSVSQSTVIDDFNGDNFDHTGLGFIRGGSIQARNQEVYPIVASKRLAPGVPTWGSDYKRWVHENAQSVGTTLAQLEILSYERNFLDLDPNKKDELGMPVIRVTFDLGDNEIALSKFLIPKMREILTEMGATQTWGADQIVASPITTHLFGGTRMGNEPESSVVDKYCISHEAPNLAVIGGSNFCSTTGYNPTQTIQAVAWHAAEYIAKNFQSIAV
jgi:gluconate 2-dehydrogenase alpha chain